MLSASQAEIPAPQSVLPVAILERPSLEVSEMSDMVHKQMESQQSPRRMDHLTINHRPAGTSRSKINTIEANRKVAFKPE